MRLEPALLGSALLLAGCADDQGTLAVLQDAYGTQTADALSAPLTATVLAAAVAGDLCTTSGGGAWEYADAGEVPPMEPELLEALGDPVVAEVVSAGSLEIDLDQVAILGGVDRSLSLVVSGSTPVTVTGSVFDDADGALGSFTLEVLSGCTPQFMRVSGTAQWTDDAGDTHAFTLPAEGSGDSGLDFPGLTAWLPAAGSASWSGRVDAEQRAFTTDDASTIERYGAGGLWTGTVSGLEWSSEITAELQPL